MIEYFWDGEEWVGYWPNNRGDEMRSIYLRKEVKPECPSCGGQKISRPVGFTVGGEAVYSCKDGFHVRIDPEDR